MIDEQTSNIHLYLITNTVILSVEDFYIASLVSLRPI